MDIGSFAKLVASRIMLLVLGIGVALFIGEFGVRLFHLEDYAQISQITELSKLPKRGIDSIGEDWRFKFSTNPNLRYEPNKPQVIPKSKPPGELRILCLGDSIADNQWQPKRTTFPGILEKVLDSQTDLPWEKCVVVNSAVTGYNAIQYYEWYNKQWRDYQFDFVILSYCCFNDRTEMRVVDEYDGNFYCVMGREYTPYIFQFKGDKLLLRFSALYRFLNIRLVPYFEARGRKIHEYRRDYTFPTQTSLLALRELCEGNGSRFILISFPLLVPEETESGWIRRLAEVEGITHIDMKPVFEEVGYDKVQIGHYSGPKDNLHPNQKGHNLAARLLSEKILNDKVATLPLVYCKENLPGNVICGENISVTASSHNHPNEDVFALYDYKAETYWHVSTEQIGSPAWITVDLGEAKAVRMLAARPRASHPFQFFRHAELSASTDGRSWKPIVTINELETPHDNAWRLWDFDNTQAYCYYKLDIFDGHAGQVHNFYSLAELSLFE